MSIGAGPIAGAQIGIIGGRLALLQASRYKAAFAKLGRDALGLLPGVPFEILRDLLPDALGTASLPARLQGGR